MPIEIQDKIHFYRDSPMGINIKCFNYLTNNTNFDTYISSEKEFNACINIINKFKTLPGTCSEAITYIQENKCLVIGFTKESQIIHYITKIIIKSIKKYLYYLIKMDFLKYEN